MNNPLGVSPGKGKQGTTTGGRGFDSHRGPTEVKRFFLCLVLGLTPSGLFMGLSSTIIYTSELILCSTICVPSATRHNIHMYPYFLLAAIHHLKSSPTFSVRPCSSVGRVTVDLIRRSGIRFPPRSKYFFFASCGSLFPFTRANAQWVIHGFKEHYNLHFRVNSLFHYLCSQCYAAQYSYVPSRRQSTDSFDI